MRAQDCLRRHDSESEHLVAKKILSKKKMKLFRILQILNFQKNYKLKDLQIPQIMNLQVHSKILKGLVNFKKTLRPIYWALCL